MLAELRVENVGVIDEMGLLFGPGMTAITGETGAGKTLVVESIELLLGGRADAAIVRRGASEARVEARFELDPAACESVRNVEGLEDAPVTELVVARVVPVEGRSRAYVNGRIVPAATLGEVGRRLVDLHGQNTHQALLRPASQRAALDAFGGPELATALTGYGEARAEYRRLRVELDSLGGDERARAREIDLLRFQVEEIDAAAISGPDEEADLEAQEALLASAGASRAAAGRARAALEDTVVDAVGSAIAELGPGGVLGDQAARLRALQDEASDAARELRSIEESIEEDPERLAAVGDRRRLLRELRRKYGETLHDVLAFRAEAAARLEELQTAEARATELEARLEKARHRLDSAASGLSAARREAAPVLASRIEAELRELALPAAALTIEVRSSDEPGGDAEHGRDDVEFLLAANPGEGARPLAKAASGGELARAMLAARVVVTQAPPTVVFDEVDAGIGGQAGVAVGRRLAAVANRHQVLCVTHLAQVAAFADHHVVVEKATEGARTSARVSSVEGADRVRELSRMLAGSDSARAREHAEELLADAAGSRP